MALTAHCRSAMSQHKRDSVLYPTAVRRCFPPLCSEASVPLLPLSQEYLQLDENGRFRYEFGWYQGQEMGEYPIPSITGTLTDFCRQRQKLTLARGPTIGVSLNLERSCARLHKQNTLFLESWKK